MKNRKKAGEKLIARSVLLRLLPSDSDLVQAAPLYDLTGTHQSSIHVEFFTIATFGCVEQGRL